MFTWRYWRIIRMKCPKCGYENKIDACMCAKCYFDLGSGKVPVKAPPQGAENRRTASPLPHKNVSCPFSIPAARPGRMSAAFCSISSSSHSDVRDAGCSAAGLYRYRCRVFGAHDGLRRFLDPRGRRAYRWDHSRDSRRLIAAAMVGANLPLSRARICHLNRA